MKKINIYFLSAVSFLLILSACSGNEGAESVENNANGQESSKADSKPEMVTKTITTVDENGNKTTTTVEVPKMDTKKNNAVRLINSDDDPNKNSGTVSLDDKRITVQDLKEPDEELEDEEDDDYDFHAYVKLNAFLGKYVTGSGNVNYASIKSNKSDLEDILKEFESNDPNTWTTAQKLTYWINAYNIYTIKLIVDNYPTTSITNITAKPWHKSFIKLNGKTYSLNQIENDIIRKQFNEPRVHFALNCASKSCPILLNKAYLPGTVYSQMTTQTKRFLNDTSKNTFGAKEIKISKIFEWYVEDFTKGGTTVIDFINKYRTEQLTNQKITYSEYSWDLNK